MNSQLEQAWINSWLKLANYLSDEKLDGKTIFTLSFQDGGNFIVHPEGRNGTTLDLTLCFDIPKTGSPFPIHKTSDCCNIYMSHTIASTKEGKLNEDYPQTFNMKKRKYPIIIDGETYFVQQYLTFAQVKRLAGCDNQFYTVKICEPISENYKDKDIIDNEVLDLEMPYAPRAFQTLFSTNGRVK